MSCDLRPARRWSGLCQTRHAIWSISLSMQTLRLGRRCHFPCTLAFLCPTPSFLPPSVHSSSPLFLYQVSCECTHCLIRWMEGERVRGARAQNRSVPRPHGRKDRISNSIISIQPQRSSHPLDAARRQRSAQVVRQAPRESDHARQVLCCCGGIVRHGTQVRMAHPASAPPAAAVIRVSEKSGRGQPA